MLSAAKLLVAAQQVLKNDPPGNAVHDQVVHYDQQSISTFAQLEQDDAQELAGLQIQARLHARCRRLQGLPLLRLRLADEDEAPALAGRNAQAAADAAPGIEPDPPIRAPLESVHGVRMPMKKLRFALRSIKPMKIKSSPIAGNMDVLILKPV